MIQQKVRKKRRPVLIIMQMKVDRPMHREQTNLKGVYILGLGCGHEKA